MGGACAFCGQPGTAGSRCSRCGRPVGVSFGKPYPGQPPVRLEKDAGAAGSPTISLDKPPQGAPFPPPAPPVPPASPWAPPIPPPPQQWQPGQGSGGYGTGGYPPGGYPPPGAFPPGPPPAGAQPRSTRGLIIALLVAAIVLLGSGIAVAAFVQHGSTGGHEAAGVPLPAQSSAMTTEVASAPPPQAASAGSSVSSVASTTATPSSAPTPTASSPTSAVPVPPATTSDMDLSRVAADPNVRKVAHLLDTYFTGINTGDPARAASVFTHDGAVNPSDPNAVARFGHDISTSRDSRIVVLDIRRQGYEGRPGLLVHVRFRSEQAPNLGPAPGESCTHWNLWYIVRQTAPDRFKLVRSENVSHHAC